MEKGRRGSGEEVEKGLRRGVSDKYKSQMEEKKEIERCCATSSAI